MLGTKMAEPWIELDGVDVAHENAPEDVVVSAVTWRIGAGDLWVVGGEVGSGKSTLLATAAGLARAAAGSVRIFGREVGEATEVEQVAWRQQIGLVYEGGGRLLSHLNVAENVALPLLYHTGSDRAEAESVVDDALDRAGLKPYAHWWPSRLSARVQQRVAFVRAVIMPKRVLFLDNVLANLTPAAARWWIDSVQQARSRADRDGQPMAVVVSANDMRGWLDVATRFAMVRDHQFQVLNGRDEAHREGTQVWSQLETGAN
jgi:ABC-type transporter Mla maintaining outer membrane lipid asymmetry ATPase subunit MlaF